MSVLLPGWYNRLAAAVAGPAAAAGRIESAVEFGGGEGIGSHATALATSGHWQVASLLMKYI